VKKLEKTIVDTGGLPELANDILQFAGTKRVFAFYGEMGSGKTTIIKQLCKQLGSHDNFSSPSYSIVHEYLLNPGGYKIYHIDLYRLKNADEALALGIEDYITGLNYCFIEWPALIEQLLPEDVINVLIKHEADMRKISIFMG